MSHINRSLSTTDAMLHFRLDCLSIVHEYCKLASKKELSPCDADRLNDILELAETDGWLDFWINEADHFMAHELGNTDPTSIYHFENQQAKLRERLNCETIKNDYTLLEELKQRFKLPSKELQQHLKNRGFDPGPIDGVWGPQTHSALIAFQTENQLEPTGIPDVWTREALGLR
ncbi:peptidoglycan-binding protein [Oculatella sp. LEGE 06141]|uniref:peptidoglycan-binding domain-containing protein n=1 Tax=Oculatella sp. LEGE 06141 TaxID=1828648 RepID=UPI00188045EE|nr:peptidoglycan-binding domain-containing protein [Oculatella sp. LEGE 06141]MBE9178115.1 peptidoglycan-binding protein [Oculatella sp. LEGE 06141]